MSGAIRNPAASSSPQNESPFESRGFTFYSSASEENNSENLLMLNGNKAYYKSDG